MPQGLLFFYKCGLWNSTLFILQTKKIKKAMLILTKPCNCVLSISTYESCLHKISKNVIFCCCTNHNTKRLSHEDFTL